MMLTIIVIHLVKSALKHKHIHIVSYDWLEDSLLRKTRKREAPYLMKTVLKAAANKKKNRKEKIQKPRVKKERKEHFKALCAHRLTPSFKSLNTKKAARKRRLTSIPVR